MKLPIRVKMVSEFIYPDGKIDPEDDFKDRVEAVVDADDETVCYTECGYFRMPLEDAQLIVAAVNSHQKLVDALKVAQGFVEEAVKQYGFGDVHTLPTINEALESIQ